MAAHGIGHSEQDVPLSPFGIDLDEVDVLCCETNSDLALGKERVHFFHRDRTGLVTGRESVEAAVDLQSPEIRNHCRVLSGYRLIEECCRAVAITGRRFHNFYIPESAPFDICLQIGKILRAWLEAEHASQRPDQRGIVLGYISYMATNFQDLGVAGDQRGEEVHAGTLPIAPIPPIAFVFKGVEPQGIAGPVVPDGNVAWVYVAKEWQNQTSD